MEGLNKVLSVIDNWVWGVPLIVLIMAVGILLSVRTKFVQIFHLPKALKFMLKDEEGGEGERSEDAPREVLPLIDILSCDLWAEAKRYGLDRDDLKRAAKQDGRAGIRAYLADLREAAAFHPLE